MKYTLNFENRIPLMSKLAGSIFRDKLLEEHDNLPRHGVLLCSFEGIDFDYTFADESLGVIAEWVSKWPNDKEQYLIISDLSEISLENLKVSLERRSKKEKPKRDIVLFTQNEERTSLIGHIQLDLQDLWQKLQGRPSPDFGSKDIAVDYKITPNAANGKLMKLWERRLIRKHVISNQNGKSNAFSRVLAKTTYSGEEVVLKVLKVRDFVESGIEMC